MHSLTCTVFRVPSFFSIKCEGDVYHIGVPDVWENTSMNASFLLFTIRCTADMKMCPLNLD
jgi:hypothetical protein